MLGPLILEEEGAHLIKQLFDAAAIRQGPLEYRPHGLGHVQAPPPALLGEGQQVVGMLVPAGTGRAVGAKAGFADPGQRPFEGRPQRAELLPETLFPTTVWKRP
jgi:hypothetical protein